MSEVFIQEISYNTQTHVIRVFYVHNGSAHIAYIPHEDLHNTTKLYAQNILNDVYEALLKRLGTRVSSSSSVPDSDSGL